MIPTWIHTVSVAFIVLGFICAIWIALDEWKHPQRMPIMNLVLPLVALFGTAITLWGYFTYGRLAAADVDKAIGKSETPFWVMVGKGAAHCGSGCALGDIIAEWAAFAFPAIAVFLGWQTLFAEKLFAVGARFSAGVLVWHYLSILHHRAHAGAWV